MNDNLKEESFRELDAMWLHLVSDLQGRIKTWVEGVMANGVGEDCEVHITPTDTGFTFSLLNKEGKPVTEFLVTTSVQEHPNTF